MTKTVSFGFVVADDGTLSPAWERESAVAGGDLKEGEVAVNVALETPVLDLVGQKVTVKATSTVVWPGA